ncbi:outer membrane protein assembly factor BamB family protein [Streptomyces sp. NBC_01803]|uniref:outer membrane protein assembly factor BamB family protein n=1 Tax=Streptomyces sp. NBC_01803 TaxID=2975946 RepID=UPI002DDC3BA0|nr:PQQ-binding-like beta-propeller repeat protein [Streptomyces sp. NBC_01803]WSA44936.1 PQQ-like beta-propeller repeat protein [Streptomyces sp. NBC_01803]
MAEGNSRMGLIVLPVGMALLALLTVWVVVFSREAGRTATEDVDGGLVAGTAATTTGDEPPAELAQVWHAPAIAAGIGAQDATATRLWANDETVTVVSTAGVSGYGAVDGEPLWDAPLPEGATRPCAAAERVNAAGTGAVLYAAADPVGADPPGSCSVLGAIDTESGELLWSADLLTPDGRAVEAGGVTVTVGNDTVTVNLDTAGSPTGFHRFEAETGTELAAPEPPGGLAWDCATGRQTLAIRHADSRVVALTRCGGEPELSVYHADTGGLEWTHPGSDPDLGFTDIVAGDPVLLHQDDDLVGYSENGDELWRLPMADLVPAESAVVGEVLVARRAPAEEAADAAVFTGYDLTDGSPLWEAELPEDVRLFDADDNGRLLLGHPTADSLELLRLSPADGTDTPAGAVPLDTRRTNDEPYMVHDEHQLYVMATIETPTAQGLRLRAFER